MSEKRNMCRNYTDNDLQYICSQWGTITARQIAVAVGRSPSAVNAKVFHLRETGEFDHYARMGSLTQAHPPRQCPYSGATEATCRKCGGFAEGFCETTNRFCVSARSGR